MLAPFLVSVLVIFVVIMIAVALASKFWDNKRKKQVISMLKTASGEEHSEISISNLLMAPSEDGRSFMERFIEGLDVAQKLQTKMTQAGLDWTPTKFLVLMVMCTAVGVVVGLRFSFLGYGTTSLVLGLAFSLMPYLY